ncbi:MAG TPA: hypothetical protein VEB62_02960 [Brevundimonas sp.]|nr:hypothetical protein [Brevundimonas sp.]
MVSDLSDHPLAWRARICRHIDSGKVATSFSYQAELAMCWATSRVATIRPLGTVEFDDYPPDIVSDDLFPGWLSVIEVAMVSKGDPMVPGRYPLTLRKGPWRIGRSPVGNKIDEKDRNQLSKVPDQAIRILALVDGGSRETEEPNGLTPQWNAASPREVLSQAAQYAKHIDLIAVIYRRPVYGYVFASGSPAGYDWAAEIYNLTGKVDPQPLNAVIALLPPIKAAPVRLRHLADQEPFLAGALNGSVCTGYRWSRETGTSVMVSSRTLQKFLCQEAPLDYFEQEAMKHLSDLFREQTASGRVVKGVSLESGAPDDDDDLVVFEFGRDASTEQLKPTKP